MRLQITRTARWMIALIVVLASLEIAYLSKLFYWGQIPLFLRQQFPGLYYEPIDVHHAPLLGCEVPPGNDIHTHFFHVKIEQQYLAGSSRVTAGGGMTSWRNNVLLLDGAGRLFVVDETTTRKLQISLPDNGQKIFNNTYKARKIAKPVAHFRYNDVLATDAGIYVSYTEWNNKKACYTNTVAYAPVQDHISTVTDLERSNISWNIIYRSSPCLPAENGKQGMQLHMAGGRLALFDHNTLLLSVGDFTVDGKYPTGAHPQQRTNDYGKIIAIDMRTDTSTHVSIGHRNPQGITVDNDGEIWVVEHGPRGGDELNHVKSGKNYGWPEATLGTAYNTLQVKESLQFGRHDNHESPIFSWLPSLGVSSIVQIKGFDQIWDGDFLVGTLALERLYRIRIKNNRVLFSEPICIGRRVRYVHQHNDGVIYAWTDSGHIVTIRAPIKSRAEKYAKTLEKLGQCLECHTIDGGAGLAPGIFDLAEKDEIHLKWYVTVPESRKADTQMPIFDLSEKEMQEIITAIQSLQ